MQKQRVFSFTRQWTSIQPAGYTISVLKDILNFLGITIEKEEGSTLVFTAGGCKFDWQFSAVPVRAVEQIEFILRVIPGVSCSRFSQDSIIIKVNTEE